MIQLNDQQQEAARPDRSAAVISSAGTGKTAMLTQRYLNHVIAGMSPLRMVAVTFTEQAAHELRGRVRAALAAARPARLDSLAELEVSPIGTIHSLCARICREHPSAAGVPAAFEVLDEESAAILAAEQREDILNSLPLELFLGPAGVPLSLAERLLPRLLDSPHLAAEALAAMDRPWVELRTEWEAGAAALREAARAELCDRSWQEAAALLRELRCLNESDKLYPQWRAMLPLLQQVEEAPDPTAAIEALAAGSLSGGGKEASWSAPVADIRAACKTLRDGSKKAVERGLINVTIGDDDQQLHAMARTLQEILERVSAARTAIKERAGVLEFADLELGALRALEHESVREWYRERWQVLLLDEAQDINRTQAVILERLAGLFDGGVVCAVGDEKQAIYGFRGADVAEFRRFRDEVIVGRLGGRVIDLDRTYRQHRPLADSFNSMFGALLPDLHREVVAERDAPHPHPRFVEYLCLAEAAGSKEQCRRVEGYHLAQRIRRWLDEPLAIHDRGLGSPRDLEPGDVAILSRAWQPLDIYAEALAAAGIPAVHAGGGSLLATREAKDGVAMLRLLASPRRDNLALAAVLRGPWFGLSDRVLLELATAAEGDWWGTLARLPATTEAGAVLAELDQAAGVEVPSRVLQRADRLTGYSAVLARLPMAPRRLADWRGFIELVRAQERDGADPVVVSRRLKQALELGLELPRPVLEAGNAVSLMTIHAAKGLEFPVVIVPDLDRGSPATGPALLLDRRLGAGFRFRRPDGEQARPYLWRVLERRERERELAERRRLLYVACTRAQDRLVLSVPGTESSSSNTLHDLISPCWRALGGEPEAVVVTAEAALPPAVPAPAPPPPPAPEMLLLEPVGPCLASLAVTALDDYAQCPKLFEFAHLLGHPGLSEGEHDGSSYAQRVGTLVHAALQHGLREQDEIAQFDRDLPAGRLNEAVELVERFHTLPEFARFHGDAECERPVGLRVGALELQGRADLAGGDWVLDFKTGEHVSLERHRFQLWAYARALEVPAAYLADLRRGKLLAYQATELADLGAEAEALVADLQAGQFEPRPETGRCQACGYQLLCPAVAKRAAEKAEVAG